MVRPASTRGRAWRGLALLACLLAGSAVPAASQHIDPEIAARLTREQQHSYLLYLRGRAVFDRRLDAYWDEVEEKRAARRRKRRTGRSFTADDYVGEQPPVYDGPRLPPEVAKVVERVRADEPEADPLPGVADFLANAKAHYGFVPSPSSEREFKRRYAEEALAAGLTKMQVVRVFALETGGRGTYDMQAGIDPGTKRGRPISTALGYAQLLSANSTSELRKHGAHFIARLRDTAARRGTDPRRAAALRAKAGVVERMLRVARSVPNRWSDHMRLARTPKGQGIHALNMDADVGPWLQVLKLKGVLQTAVRAGRPNLTGAELELMNLAGPGTGLEMMQPAGREAPTSNFFSRRGYYRNSIARARTAADLLNALDERMTVYLKKAGSLEFIAIFDEVAREQREER